MSLPIYRIALNISQVNSSHFTGGGKLSDPVLILDDEDEQHTRDTHRNPPSLPRGENASDPMIISDDENEQAVHQTNGPSHPSPLSTGSGTSATTAMEPISMCRVSEPQDVTGPQRDAVDGIHESPILHQPARAPVRARRHPATTLSTPPRIVPERQCIHNTHSDTACVHKSFAPTRDALSDVYEAIDRRKPHPFCISGIPFTHSDDTLVQNIHVLKMRVEKKGRIVAHLSTRPCPRHPAKRNWPLIKIVAARTVHSVAMCMKKIGPYHASHTCGNGDFCVDLHCNIESGIDNFGREDCFNAALDDYEQGIAIPEFCSEPKHARAKCRLWLKVEGTICPQSMLIKEKAMFLGKRPEQLSEDDVGHLFLVSIHGTPDPKSQLASEDFSYVVWDYTRDNRQLPQIRRLELSDAQKSGGPPREVDRGNGQGFFQKLKMFADLAHL